MTRRMLGVHEFDGVDEAASEQHRPDAVHRRSRQQRVVTGYRFRESLAAGEFWDGGQVGLGSSRPALLFLFSTFGRIFGGWNNVELWGTDLLLAVFAPGFV